MAWTDRRSRANLEPDGCRWDDRGRDRPRLPRAGRRHPPRHPADLDALSITLIADFDAPREEVWRLWADPRLLERWWGPPTYPATFEEHDLTPGGRAAYFMTGPDGDRPRGWWRITAVDPPASLELVDGFADDQGNPNDGMPTMTVVMRLSEHDGGTRMELRSTYASREDMQRIVEMGGVEGLSLAVGQMDGILAG